MEDKKWDSRIDERSKSNQEYVDKVYKKIKKKIGRDIFFIMELYDDKYDKYYIAKEIHRRIFEYEDDYFGSMSVIKKSLAMPHHILMNDLIKNEISEIYKLQYKIEDLERENKSLRRRLDI